MFETTLHAYKMICSGKNCDHIFHIYDTIFPIENDRGYVIFKCPKCNSLTKIHVHNVYHFDGQPNVYDIEEFDFATTKYDSVPSGEIKEMISREIEPIKIERENIWCIDGRNLEKEGKELLNNKLIFNALTNLKNGYLAGSARMYDINRLIFRVPITVGDNIHYIIFMKEVDNEHDINLKNLHTVIINGVSIESLYDGVHTRNRCFSLLENMLRRWRLTANEVFFVSPFIGMQYKNEKYEQQTRAFWDWLSSVLDYNKSRLITRKGSFNLLREAIDKSEEDFNKLKKWGELTEIIRQAAEYDGRKKNSKESSVILYQKFHAKFYAGVYDDHVEVLTASYNLHLGDYYENFTLKRYDRVFFEENFLKPFGLSYRDLNTYIFSAFLDYNPESREEPSFKPLPDSVFNQIISDISTC